jgi:uridine kinase
MDFNTLQGNFTTFAQLIQHFNNERNGATYLVGIDGGGGAGKSTFANALKDLDSQITLIHKDDFYLPSNIRPKDEPDIRAIGSDFDWQRLLEQVLKPLSVNEPTRYQRYDWDSDQLAEWHEVPTNQIVIIEGVYSLRPELAEYYNYKIWIETPYDTRLERGIERDGEAAREMWVNNWLVAEDLYKVTCKPFENADLIVSGMGE